MCNIRVRALPIFFLGLREVWQGTGATEMDGTRGTALPRVQYTDRCVSTVTGRIH